MTKTTTSRPKAVRARSRARRAAGAFETLVGREPAPLEKIAVIREGLRAGVVDDMVAYLGVPKSAVFALLRTAESTAHKLVKEGRPLDAGASERVLRIADVARAAEETFGGRDAGTLWLRTPNLSLGRETPLSLLDTGPGADEVRRVLAAIDHGGTL